MVESSSQTISDTRAGLRNRFRGRQTGVDDKTELERYRSDPHDPTPLEDDFDILTW